MNVRQSAFSLLAALLTATACQAQDTLAAPPDSAAALHTRYERRVERLVSHWNAMVPNLSTLQYAGDIGMLSLGIGWDYGRRNQWETYLLFGYVPKHHTPDELWTMTVKEIYTPWTLHLGGKVHVCPLFVMLMASTTLSGEFWVSEPSRYPKGYYGFSSKIRFHVGVGQKIKICGVQRRSHWFKDLALYYEVSTCDLYVRQRFLNHSVPLGDIICLALGVQYTIF